MKKEQRFYAKVFSAVIYLIAFLLFGYIAIAEYLYYVDGIVHPVKEKTLQSVRH